MTFTEIVDEIKDRLNLTSPTATERVGRLVNWRYRRLLGSVGLDSSTRTQIEVVAPFAVASRTFEFTNVLKIYSLWYFEDSGSMPIYIDERSIDELRS